MGKPDSYCFCRVHDAKLSGDAMSQQDLDNTLNFSIALECMSFIDKNPQLATPALKAYIAYSLKPMFYQEHEAEYMSCLQSFNGDPNQIGNALFKDLVPHLNDPSCGGDVEIILAYLDGAWGLNGNAEALEESRQLLDKHLNREGSDDFANGTWILLAEWVDFEPWHDAKYGNQIVGRSKYFGLDPDGNPLKNNAGASVSSSSSKNSGGGGCYVATAVYGSYDCPQVWTLRRFRDYELAETRHGRMFIRFYYATSPTLVKWFGETQWFKSIIRPRLDQFVGKLQSDGYESSPYVDKRW